MAKAQEYFENTFSINRETIEYSGWDKSEQEKLEGDLDLKEFKKLKKLDIQGNKITSIKLFNCSELEYLDLGGNPLTSIDLSNNVKLTKISFADCPIQQDLITFSHLKDLEYLNIGKTPFYGSLKGLANNKLVHLYMSACLNIKEGWEFLPDSLKDIDKNQDDLFFTLKDYQNNFPAWKKDHNFLINRVSKLEEKLTEQEKITSKVLSEKEQLEKQLTSEKETFLTAANKLNNYISQLEKQLEQSKLEAKVEIPLKNNQ